MQATLKLHSLPFSNSRTYLTAAVFILGNIVTPQLFHLVPQGGVTWLPIYFFTLIGAYKYGWKVGLITAIASPVINSLLFGMPHSAALPAIMLKSVLLALFAGYTAHRYNKASLTMLAFVVFGYQILGSIGEWAITGSISAAGQDFRIGIPGMLLQVFGGWAIINNIHRN